MFVRVPNIGIPILSSYARSVRTYRITLHLTAFSLACPVGPADRTGEPSALSIAAKRIDPIHYSSFDPRIFIEVENEMCCM